MDISTPRSGSVNSHECSPEKEAVQRRHCVIHHQYILLGHIKHIHFTGTKLSVSLQFSFNKNCSAVIMYSQQMNCAPCLSGHLLAR